MQIQNVVNEQQLFEILEKTKKPMPERVREILVTALEKRGLTLEETSCLLHTENPDLIQEYSNRGLLIRL